MKTGKIEGQRRVAALRAKARRLQFSRRVDAALRYLPEQYRQYLDNVAIVVEDEPPAASPAGESEELFGLYHGIPRSQRYGGYSMVVPDQITVFRGPLTRAFGIGPELDEEIRITVLHELGHHLGFDEDGLDQMGLA
ncbi:MAG TPA: metallopeptidase family protein [Thermomicrobiales bacterium]|nr:metallopeptidase family protein [Thermomicrobiales bacterium]